MVLHCLSLVAIHKLPIVVTERFQGLVGGLGVGHKGIHPFELVVKVIGMGS